MAARNGYVTLFEARSRKVRISSQGGTEIVIIWYCEPASAACIAVGQLLGSITGTDNRATRILPASDFVYPYYYCVSARETAVDDRVTTNSPALSSARIGDNINDFEMINDAIDGAIISDGPLSLDSGGDYISLPEADDIRGRSGAWIEAIYSPIYSAYIPVDPSNPTDQDYINSFDYVDPQFAPASRSLQGPPGYLYARYNPSVLGIPLEPFNYPVPDVANLSVETWQEFTIRRVQCPSVPWTTINSLVNRVNKNPWIPTYFSLPSLPVVGTDPNKAPGFPAGTLRFDYAEVIPHTMPLASTTLSGTVVNTDPNNGLPVATPIRWYDILYKFSWHTVYDSWYRSATAEESGDWIREAPDWLGWNLTFTGPFGVGITNDYTPVGWYYTYYDDRTAFFTSVGGRAKYLFDTDSTTPLNTTGLPMGALDPFDALFLLNAY